MISLIAHLSAPAVEPLHFTLPDLTLLAYVVAFIGGVAFILAYLRTDWRHHPWGRHVMAFMVTMETVCALSVTRRLFGEYPGRELALFVTSWMFAGIVWWRYVLLRRGQRGPTGPGDHRDSRGYDDHHPTAATQQQPEA